MEKRRNVRRTVRRRHKNYKENTKEIIINLFLKQSAISIFLFVLIIIFQFLPFQKTTLIMENIEKEINYTMSWNEAIQTVKNTAIYIPIVKDLVKENNKIENNNNLDNVEENVFNNNTVETNTIINDKSYTEEEISNGDSEDIFILEPEVGESEKEIVP